MTTRRRTAPKSRPSPEPTKALASLDAMPVTSPAVPDRSLLPLEGSIHIGRPQGDHCDYISIEITDETSHVRFVDARIKYADLTLALTGQIVPVTFELRGTHLVGSQAEHKTENVPWDRCLMSPITSSQALAPFEIDGWTGDISDLTNRHRHQPDGTQRVTFRRHVDPKTGKPILPPTLP